MPISVVVADDHTRLRDVLTSMIDMDERFEVVGAASDGREAIECAERLQPDLILLDVSMPRLSGLEALPAIRAASPRSVVFLHTADADAETVSAAERHRARWIEKSTPIDALLERLAGAAG